MNRKEFIKISGILLGGTTMKLNALSQIVNGLEDTEITMPALFVGHGSPMNAIEDNMFSRAMKDMGTKVPKPKAILMVSAHWETKGTFVTAQDMPPTIHDFGGFPKELHEAQYPAPGSKWLAEETKNTITKTQVELNEQWGFDHGCWSVTKNMFPNADVPIIQMSLDYRQNAQYHYELGKELSSLRKKGVLIIGSGNMVHNFQYASMKAGDFNMPFGHDWAIEANETFKKLIQANDFKALIDYKKQGKALDLSAPTPEHYLPMLYAISLRQKNEEIAFFNDVLVGGSFSMTSVKIG